MTEFNINNYDKPGGLYDLLDVEPTISDRELEAKILSMINEYKTAKATTDGNDDEYDTVIQFMIDIYRFFFDNETPDVDNETGPTDFNGDDRGDGIGDSRGRDITLKNKPYDKRNDDSTFNADVQYDKNIQVPKQALKLKLDGGTDDMKSVEIAGANTVRKNKTDTNNQPTKFNFSYPLQYAINENGQIINQSTKRIVSINSNSRYNTTGTTSSSFTLNLSETLKNVVKMKLYSVSIPYSWYTISEDYGSNFFYLKGNSPGIYNSTHDIKVEIEPGNYDKFKLVEILNANLEIIKTSEYIDVSFNNTNFVDVPESGSGSGKTKFIIDINKNYDSNYFRVRFPYITPVYTNFNTKERNNTLSIPSFLGFTTDTLNSYTARSDLSGGIPTDITIDASNNTIKILRYTQQTNSNVGPPDRSNIVKTIDLYFVPMSYLNIDTSLNDAITNNVDIDKNSNYTIDPSGNYLKLKLKRDDSINHLDTKIIMLFPFDFDGNGNIWTDELKFKTDGVTDYDGISYKYKILNDVISQEPAIDDRIVVPSTRSIKLVFEPTKALYNGKNNYDISLNEFKIDISYNDVGYIVDEFISQVNSGFGEINTSFADKHNTSIFNSPTNNDIMYLDNDNKLNIAIDISYNLGISNYTLDLSNTLLGNLLSSGLTYYTYDLSLNDGLVKVVENVKTLNGYNIATILGDNAVYVLKLKPKEDGPLRNLPDINIETKYLDSSGNDVSFNDAVGISLADLTNYIHLAIMTHEDNSYNVENLLSGSSFSLVDVSGSGESGFALSLNVRDYLDQNNYKLHLTDDTSNVWNEKFHLDSSYDLINKVIITSKKTIDKDIITINAGINDQIIIEPLPVDVDGGSNGVFDTLNRNTVNIIIDNGDYTRDELLEEINELLEETKNADNKELSKDMSFKINDDGYCSVDFNLNRTFKPEDFKVVFFDNTFSNCNSGSSSIQNTTFDSTIGYILGYRDKTEYPLKDVAVPSTGNNDVITFTSAQQINVNLYNEFSIVLDDYNNNRLPSAIISGEPPSTNFELPTYAKRSGRTCDGSGNYIQSIKDKNNNNLTINQLSAIYSNIETSQATQSDIFSANKKVNAKDVFAVIPLNVSNLSPGQLFVKEGITLQEQERSYFGPVDIQRISVKLLTDKGTLVNLNKDNWSFSFVCEQLHDQTLGQYIDGSKDDNAPFLES
jgi:hypothetical protein